MGSVGRAPSQCKSVSFKGAVDDADEEDEEDDSGERAPPTWQRSAAAAAPASTTRLRARDPSVAATRGAASAAGAADKGEDDDFKDDRASTSFGKASKLQWRQAGSRCGPFMRHRDDAREPPKKLVPTKPPREVQRSAAPASSASPRELERAPRGLPRWCTFEQSIDVWVDELNTFQIDATAQKELFLLAQLSERGYQESNAIVGKLLKKQADGVFIGNASGFVHACVNNARAKISREDGTSWK